MKHLWLVLLCAGFLGTGCATQKFAPVPRFEKVSLQPIEKAQKETKTHITKAKEITKTLVLTLPADIAKVNALEHELDSAQEALSRAEGAREAAQGQADEQTRRANLEATEHEKANLQILQQREEIKVIKAKHHRARFILSGLAFLAVGYAMWRFKALFAVIPPPYNLIVMLGAPAVVALLINLLL